MRLRQKMRVKMATIKLWLLAGLIFFTPSNLFIKFGQDQAYVGGLLVDYLLVKIHLSDIIIALLLLTFLIKYWQKKLTIAINKKSLLILLTLISVVLLRQLFTHKPLAGFFYAIKVFEFILLAKLLVKEKDLFKNKIILYSVFFTLIFQSAVGLYQFLAQQSVFGFAFLGESNLQNFYGISKASFAGNEKILAYGTTAHPNILAGFAVVYSLILLKIIKNNWLIKIFIIALNTLILSITQSWSAGITLVISLIYINSHNVLKIIKHKINFKLFFSLIIICSLLIVLFLQRIALFNNTDSVSRRNILNQVAWQMFRVHPLLGIGLNNFTANINLYNNNHQLRNFVQPVHHVVLLLLAENGIVGLAMIFQILQLIKVKIKAKKLAKACLLLLPIISLDHYLVTNQTGALLLIFSLIVF